MKRWYRIFWVSSFIFISCSEAEKGNSNEANSGKPEPVEQKTPMPDLSETEVLKLPFVLDSSMINQAFQNTNHNKELHSWISSLNQNKIENDGLITACLEAKQECSLITFGKFNKGEIEYILTAKKDKDYSDLYLLKLANDGSCLSIDKIGSCGQYSYVESGEEMDAKYEITHASGIDFIANFNQNEIKVETKRWSSSKGFDWRVDQDLKIDENIIEEPVLQTFTY